MIKTECKRRIIINSIKPPEAVIKAIDRKYPNLGLELIWNSDDNNWEFYRCIRKGESYLEDIMHWQMSVPFKGTMITPSIIDWLAKYDTTQNGRWSREELEEQWKKSIKTTLSLQKIRYMKRCEDILDSLKNDAGDILVGKRGISVPITVGYNKTTGKRILACPL